jgi:hypothetical protein
MKSQVHLQLDPEGNKIVKVQDKWNGKLPDNTLLNVRSSFIFSRCARLRVVFPEGECCYFAEFCGAAKGGAGEVVVLQLQLLQLKTGK